MNFHQGVCFTPSLKIPVKTYETYVIMTQVYLSVISVSGGSKEHEHWADSQRLDKNKQVIILNF